METIEVRYCKGITGYWFYYDLSDTLHYAKVYKSKAEFMKAHNGWNVKFIKIDEEQ